MSVKSIRVINFKSFEKLEVELGKFNVLIGANASGKSNFVHIFEFLRDITNFGLNNAISMQGGVEYLRNINIGASENFSLKVVFDKESLLSGKQTKEGFMGLKISETIYEFALKFKDKQRGGLEFEIARDNLTQKCEFFRVDRHNRGTEKKEIEELGPGEINISCVKGEVKIHLDKPEGISITEDDIFPLFLREETLPLNTLLLETSSPFLLSLNKFFSDISIYDFDTKLPKKATPITGKAELEEDGSNLSIVLKNIIKHKNEKRKFFNLVKDLLPFIDDLDAVKFADKSVLFKLREIYSEKYLPASLISDGTINITALIIALYFGEKPLTIIEEPERNIHPYIIAKLVDTMKDASQKKQIIITTHNPEIVKHTDLENLMLISRDKKGFSRISRPADNKEMKKFLKNDIGIDELYVQNLLEA